jgi:nitrilase
MAAPSASSSRVVRVGVVQHPPTLLDLGATMATAITYLREAADHGAELVVFPETYLPGYPDWVWRLRPDEGQLSAAIHRRLLENSVDLEADGLQPLREAAAEHRTVVVCGMHERDGAYGRSTLYNTLVTIGADGAILNRHRKLVPTNPERMVWGQGDASGLRVTDTQVGRLGTLICWENYMPLARYALFAQGLDIYVASTWDDSDVWVSTMRHIATEGRCWVIGSGSSLKGSDIPADFPDRDRLYPDPEEWVNDGTSVVVDPFGEIVAGPLRGQHGILYADIEPGRASAARRTLDVSGHYGRPDIFRLSVDRSLRPPVSFD